jgi:hypothetical protein
VESQKGAFRAILPGKEKNPKQSIEHVLFVVVRWISTSLLSQDTFFAAAKAAALGDSLSRLD